MVLDDNDQLRDARARAWVEGRSAGPWVQGLPEEECRSIEQRRDEMVFEELSHDLSRALWFTVTVRGVHYEG